MVLNNSVDNGKSQSYPAGILFGGKERFKYVGYITGGDARTVIG